MLNLPVKLAEEKEKSSVFFIELYHLYLRTGILRLAACDTNIIFDGNEYMAVPLERGVTKASSDSKVDDVSLKVSNFDDSFTAAIFSGADFRSCTCTIFQILYPDSLDNPLLIKPITYGYLDAPVLNQKDATFEVQVKSFVPNLSNARTLQLSCNAEFADGESCMASRDIQTGTVQSNTTVNTIVIEQTKPDGYWRGGMCTCGYESRLIEDSVGNVIYLRYPFSIVPDGAYEVERGCDKSWTNCGVNGQQMNFSGFVGIPYELVIRSD